MQRDLLPFPLIDLPRERRFTADLAEREGNAVEVRFSEIGFIKPIVVCGSTLDRRARSFTGRLDWSGLDRGGIERCGGHG